MNSSETHSGIWIDKNKALVVHTDPCKSIIVPVFFYSDKNRLLINSSRRTNGYNKFFSEIVNVLPKLNKIFILGPDQTKFMLKDYIEDKEGKINNIHSQVAGHMSTLDIVSTVRKYFYPVDREENEYPSSRYTIPNSDEQKKDPRRGPF